MLINESLLFIFLIILMASINFFEKKILLYLISIVAIPIFIVGPFLKKS